MLCCFRLIRFCVRTSVEQPSDADNPEAVYETLTAIVAQTLAFDPAAIPATAHHLIPEQLRESVGSTPSSSIASPSPPKDGHNTPDAPTLSDPDDFVIYSLDEAEHIAYAIEQAFEVDLTSEVVLAAANVSKLANRIVEARKLLMPTAPSADADPA